MRTAGETSSSLTVPQGAALSIGAVLGTGVISLPALAADLAGPASLLAWLALVLLSIPLAATFAALGARYPDGGGVSTYARRAFGRRAAAMVGWCFYFAVPVGAPAAAMFAGHYVADVLGGGPRTALVTAALITLVVATANFFGLRVSGRLQLGLASVLVVLLVVATVAALPYADLGQPAALRAARLGRGRLGRRPAGLGLRRLGGGVLAGRRLPAPGPRPAPGDRDHGGRGRRALPGHRRDQHPGARRRRPGPRPRRCRTCSPWASAGRSGRSRRSSPCC